MTPKAIFDWVRGDGVAQHNIPPPLHPARIDCDRRWKTVRLTYVPATRLTEGVNIAGYFRAELGVGEAARAADERGRSGGHSTLDAHLRSSRRAARTIRFAERGDGRAPYDINILCVNADQTPTFARQAGPAFFEGRYTAGYWFWELDRFPAVDARGFRPRR